VAARIEATTQGLDIRYVVTSLAGGDAEWLYATLYCARGQAENLIKLHKNQLPSDRTSCRSPLANQVRLVLHTAAYWLMLTLRDAIPRPQPLSIAEFDTLRARLLKVAARITETATRVRIAFAAACPEAALFAGTPAISNAPDHDSRGSRPDTSLDLETATPGTTEPQSRQTERSETPWLNLMQRAMKQTGE
jgi:hypothetical protein